MPSTTTSTHQSFFFRQMARTGRYYHIYSIAIAQLLISYPGAGLVALVKEALPRPPRPPAATMARCPGAVRSARTSPLASS